MSSDRHDDEFYVGYLDKAPPATASFVRRFVIALYAVTAVVGIAVIASHGPFDPATFEFGVARSFEGVLRAAPYPTLEVDRPGATESTSSYLLVDQGKFGAFDLASAVKDQRVELEGSLVYRQGQALVEVLPETVKTIVGETWAAVEPAELGRHTLVGEIVDSKCFLGVMNPGNLKTHKACAIRCISGGIPPILYVRSESQGTLQLLLVSESGEAVNSEVLEYVAEPIEITGRITKHGDLLLLWSDPATYKRVSE